MIFTGQCCYFVEAIGLDRFKLGFTTNIFRRFAQLQTCCPARLELLVLVNGGREWEAHYHQALRRYRVMGEWFDIYPRLRPWTFHLRGDVSCTEWNREYWEAFVEANACQTSPIPVADLSYFSVPVELASEGSN